MSSTQRGRIKPEHFLIVALLSSPSCKDGAKKSSTSIEESAKESANVSNNTVNDFFSANTPSFVLGTEGNERSDRVIASQVGLVRSFLSPSEKMLDTEIRITDPSSWPERPVLYGASHVNSVMGELGGSLPLRITAGSLRIADKHFEGRGFQIVAVIPKQDNHPEFLLFAGTGTPGVAEINAIGIGPDPIVIADSFGHLHTGQWIEDGAGKLAAELSPARRRIQWREVERQTATYSFVEALPPREDEAELIADCERGVAIAIKRLGLGATAPISIYVSPDERSKLSLTGKGGQGHAMPEFQVLHVVAMGAGALTSLVAHEATHLLAYRAFGQARTAALGEGIAVWVSGQYGGTLIKDFASTLGSPMPIRELLGPGFPNLGEQQGYMHAGLLVAAAVNEVGIKKVGEHLLGAGAREWQEACIAAGTTAAKIEAAYQARFP